MTKFTPLPWSMRFGHAGGTLRAERNSDGTTSYFWRTDHPNGKEHAYTHEQAVKRATNSHGAIHKDAYPVLFPPPLTMHHLMRERFEEAVRLAEAGYFILASRRIEYIASDYRQHTTRSAA